MLDFGFYNMDCMDGMAEFPDKYFDLAIVDPPYGINIGAASMGAGGGGSSSQKPLRQKHNRGGTDRRGETLWQFKSGEALRASQNL